VLEQGISRCNVLKVAVPIFAKLDGLNVFEKSRLQETFKKILKQKDFETRE
jgi:hypothetical protein